MKKIAAIACAVCLAGSLSACGGGEDRTEAETASDVAVESSGALASEATAPEAQPSAETVPSTSAEPAADGVTPEFKEAMDSYEAFFDEYVDFMKAYQESGDAASMLAQYSDYMAQYSETMQKINGIDSDSLSEADALYYAEVSARIASKTAELL